MKVIRRWRWRAKRPRSAKQAMIRPAAGTWIHHSVTRGGRRTKREERAHMRELQQIAFSRGFADISYSFCVFPSGRVYEGRGWGVIGAHTEGANSLAHGVCFIGNYESDRPTQDALAAAAALIRKGVRGGHVRPKGFIEGHREAPDAATACPGKHLFGKLDVIRKKAR